MQFNEHFRDLALFNLAIDSRLRDCDLVKLKLKDVAHGAHILESANMMQQKTKQPVQFKILEQTRAAISNWVTYASLSGEVYLFKSRIHHSLHISTKQYTRIVKAWAEQIGLDPVDYRTHSLRRT